MSSELYSAVPMSVKTPSVAVLGGGLSGVAAAYALARAGWKDITIVERLSLIHI